MNENSFLRRYLIVIGFFAAMCLVFVIRLASFQFFGDNEEDYREYGVKSFTYTVTIPALRGDICDRDGKIISMHRNGISQAETARTLGISRNTVARVIKDWKEEVAQKDLEIAQENLLNYGSINDCLIANALPDAPFVSLGDGHSPALPARGLLSIPIKTKDMLDGS
jgi:cell division protein FtsI/penicillin-binding protein 2